MLNIRFHFDFEDAIFDKEDIIKWLCNHNNSDEASLNELSDAELIALLSEADIEEFYDHMVDNNPVCIRCELAHD